ncbi:hypothetical protein D3C78_1064580 [compost metagenome]
MLAKQKMRAGNFREVGAVGVAEGALLKQIQAHQGEPCLLVGSRRSLRESGCLAQTESEPSFERHT